MSNAVSHFIKIELGDIKKNCFISKMKFHLPFHNRTIDTLVKIDTGCAVTCLSYRAFMALSGEGVAPQKAKQQAVCGKLDAAISFGVNDSEQYRRKQKALFDCGDYMNCTAVSFYHDIDNCTLNNYPIGVGRIRVSYDRKSSLLIGMDVISQMDFHCGVSRVSGRYTFLGCLKDDINQDYLSVIEEHFGFKQ